jgi:hypothetical protein
MSHFNPKTASAGTLLRNSEPNKSIPMTSTFSPFVMGEVSFENAGRARN